MLLNRWFKKRKIQKAALISCYQDVFKSQQGRIVLADLCKLCHIDVNTFHTDTHEMSRREGERRVALHILNMLSLNASDYLNIMYMEASHDG